MNWRLRRLLVLMFTAGVVVFLDQLSKALAVTHLSPVYPLKIIDGFFSLTLVMNSGVAFGLFSRLAVGWKTVVLLGLAGVTVLLLLGYYFFDSGLNRLMVLAFCLVIGGAVGNIIDRLKYGRVVDFLDFYWQSYHWPAFNLADAAITVGIALLLLGSFCRQKGSHAPDSLPLG